MISHRGHSSLIALAPAQARLHVSPVLYLKRNRPALVDVAVRGAVLVAGIALLQWPLLLIGIALLIWPARRILAVRRTLFRGSPLAAKVISIDPPMVACLAEMSRAINASYPMLVLMRVNLDYEENAMESGDRIAVVGLPFGGVPARADRIQAHVVSSVTAEPGGPVLDLVPEWHWDDLEDALFRMDHPYRPGLYRVS